MCRAVCHLALTGLLLARTAAAQDSVQPSPDLTFYRMHTQVVFQGPTLVVLIPIPPGSSPLEASPAMDQWRTSVRARLDSTRAVAEPLGFTVVARDPDFADISAMNGGAFYSAPRHATTGYILVAPLRNARLHDGFLDADDLKQLLQDYQSPMRPLAL